MKRLYITAALIIIVFLLLSPKNIVISNQSVFNDTLNFTKNTYDFILYKGGNLGVFEFNLKEYKHLSKTSQKKIIDDIWNLTNNYYFEFGNKVYSTNVEINRSKLKITISNAYKESDNKINEIISQATSSNMPIIEKQKNIVKYLVENFNYDYGNTNNSDINKAFETRKALCEVYSIIYFRCMQKLGVPVRIVVNNNHSWNMTKINGQWYHTDITYAAAENIDKYFNISTEKILKTRAYDVNYYPKSSESLIK